MLRPMRGLKTDRTATVTSKVTRSSTSFAEVTTISASTHEPTVFAPRDEGQVAIDQRIT